MSVKKTTLYELDHMLLDIRIQYPPSFRGNVRPWLSVCLEHQSGAILSWLLNAHHPTQTTLAFLLYEAFSSSEERPNGRIPHNLCIVTDLELALQTQQVIQLIGVSGRSGDAQHDTKRRSERFLSFIQAHLIAMVAGKSEADRGSASSDESVELTLDKLEALFQVLLYEYHSTPLDDTGRTRLSSWQECTSLRSVTPDILALLLQQTRQRTVMKHGIFYKGRRYWHPSLASLVGKKLKSVWMNETWCHRPLRLSL